MDLLLRRYTHIALFFLIPILCCVFLLFQHTAHAQFFLGETALQLVVEPQFPKPNTFATVSLDDYSFDTLGGTVTWYVNGTEQTQNRNERSIDVSIGGLGEETTVRAVIARQNASTLTSTAVIAPTVVDINIETNSYTPSFYAGRALPSDESEIRAIAVVHDGTGTSDSSYTYKWSQGQSVFFGGAIKGKNVLEFTPQRYTNAPLIVEVFNTAGEQIAREAISINLAKPELHFYEQSPLRGLFEREIKSPYMLIGEETTIYGEPYYVNAQMHEADAQFTWKVNNEIVSHNADAPNAITLRRTGSGGEAYVGLSVVTKKQIPQFIENAFQLIFN